MECIGKLPKTKNNKNKIMGKKELCYILVVAVLGVSLLMGFAVEVFNVNLGSAAWIAR